MRISPLSTISFKVTTQENTTIPDINDIPDGVIFQELRNGKYKLNEKNAEGDTFFHYLVKANKVNLVNALLLIKSNREILSEKNLKGQTPYDIAETDEMKSALTKYISSTIPSKSTAIEAEDARVILAKQSINKAKETPETNKEISFFDAFEEVDDNGITKTGVINSDADTTSLSEIAKGSKTTGKVICENAEGIDIIKDFKLLDIYPDEPERLNDLIGLDDLKQELNHTIVKPLTDTKAALAINKINIGLPNGMLFVAPANSLTIVKALAHDANLPAIILENPNELKAAKKAISNRYEKTGMKTILLANGFDKFFENTNDTNALNNFRNEIQSIKKVGGLFIATTDDKSKINCDFMHSSIIDKVFEIKKPTFDDRKEYLKRFFDKRNEIFLNLNNENEIKKIATLTDNLTYSDITRILEQSVIKAISNETLVSMDSIEKQLKIFSDETGRIPINELNKTSAYDTENFKRIPVTENEIIHLDELGGMPEVKERLRELYIEPMKNIDELQKVFGYDAIPDGAIFYGAPGNGKTITARVLARELGLPYYETKLSDFGTAFVHESGKAFKRYASQLDKKFKETGERSVWFLDEFEGLGGTRSGNHQHSDKELVDTLLQELTNPAERGYILIAATNNLEDVDSALRRRGRLGNWIEFKNPNQAEREDVIEKNLAKHDFTKVFINDKELIKAIATELDGFSYASITNILKDAKRDFYINKTDFKTAVKKALDINAKREMGEFCGKCGLDKHKYESWDFKSLDELAGMDDVVNKLRETVISTWDPDVRAAMIANKRMPSGGFMLEGPPGTGKTTIIETLAREMGIPLYKMNYNQEGNEYIHQIGKRVHEIFDRLAVESKILKTPVMLFFDEAEKFFPRHAERHQVEEVNTYKDLMNTASSKGIILAGATNHIELVNQEIIGNPRRMGNVIHCGEPEADGRKNLIQKLFKGLPILNADLNDMELQELTNVSAGLTIGNIADIADKIIIQAIKKKENLTGQKVVENFKIISGDLRKNIKM